MCLELKPIVRNIKIQMRLIILFITLVFITLLVTGYFSFKQSTNAIRKKISTYSVQLVDQIGSSLETELVRLENDSIEIQFSDLVQNTLIDYKSLSEWDLENTQNRIKETLVKKFSFLHDISDVLIYTNERDKIIAYGDVSFKFNIHDDFLDTYFSKIKANEGKTLWTAVNRSIQYKKIPHALIKDSMNTENGVLLGRGIRSLESGEIIGSIIIRINERYFSNIYKNADTGIGSDIFIMDGTGVVVSSINPDITITKHYMEPKLIDTIKNLRIRGGQAFNYFINGKRYLIAYSYIETANWYVICTIPYTYLQSDAMDSLYSIILIGLGCFIFAVAMSYVFTRSISKPLGNLVNAMNQVKEGNLSLNIIDNSYDEIGEATRNFNLMLDNIKKLMESVKKEETQKRNAELKALQSQINPHFLSNTLNTVKWLADIQNAENIKSLTSSLIDLLHLSMSNRDDYITIEQELEYLKSYINIQEYRYFNKFTVDFEIEEDILEKKILRFLLQPVVENALIHGIEPMDGQGLIVVKGYREENNLIITITDNGVGICEEKLNQILNQKGNMSSSRFNGMGIANVNERIKMSFGEDYGLKIQSIPGLYTSVEIILPII